MITKKQHREICAAVDKIRAAKIPVYTYSGAKVVSVDNVRGKIFLNDKTVITWRSYAEHTKLNDARNKFVVREMTLNDLRKVETSNDMITFLQS